MISTGICLTSSSLFAHRHHLLFTYREVDQFEFLTFMLASMRKVEPEMMMDLKDVFERLDVNGSGTVQKEDLVLAAQKRRDPWTLRKNK